MIITHALEHWTGQARGGRGQGTSTEALLREIQGRMDALLREDKKLVVELLLLLHPHPPPALADLNQEISDSKQEICDLGNEGWRADLLETARTCAASAKLGLSELHKVSQIISKTGLFSSPFIVLSTCMSIIM